MRDIERRIAALEARTMPAGRPLDREAMDKLCRIEAGIVAHYLGGWRPGGDAFRALERGAISTTPGYCRPSLTYALMKAEYRRFGSNSPDRLDRYSTMWEEMGEARHELFERLAGILDRYPELNLTRKEQVAVPSIFGRHLAPDTAERGGLAFLATAGRRSRSGNHKFPFFGGQCRPAVLKVNCWRPCSKNSTSITTFLDLASPAMKAPVGRRNRAVEL